MKYKELFTESEGEENKIKWVLSVCVSPRFCCITNHSRAQRLRPTTIYLAHGSVHQLGSSSGMGCLRRFLRGFLVNLGWAGWLASCSRMASLTCVVVDRLSAWAVEATGPYASNHSSQPRLLDMLTVKEFQKQQEKLSPNAQRLFKLLLASCLLTSHWPK